MVGTAVGVNLFLGLYPIKLARTPAWNISGSNVTKKVTQKVMVTRLPWQPQCYVNNSFVLSTIEVMFGVKLS